MPSGEFHNKTPDVKASVAAFLLIIHNNVHIVASYLKPNPPKIDQSLIERGCNEEIWNLFLQKWTMFKDTTEMIESEEFCQLY